MEFLFKLLPFVPVLAAASFAIKFLVDLGKRLTWVKDGEAFRWQVFLNALFYGALWISKLFGFDNSMLEMISYFSKMLQMPGVADLIVTGCTLVVAVLSTKTAHEFVKKIRVFINTRLH